MAAQISGLSAGAGVVRIMKDGYITSTNNVEGRYSFAWPMNGVHPLLVSKDGYTLAGAAGTFSNRISATVNGDTKFDIEVVRR